jgi:preprotein translocase subunit YajC
MTNTTTPIRKGSRVQTISGPGTVTAIQGYEFTVVLDSGFCFPLHRAEITEVLS